MDWDALRDAEFPVIVQFSSFGEDHQQFTPPPSSPEFPLIVQLIRVGEL